MRDDVPNLAAILLGLSFLVIPGAREGSALGFTVQDASELPAKRSASLRMSPGIVCRWINGYEDYEPMPGAAQTSDEKLQVYLRPMGYMTEMVDGKYQAHLSPDFEIRKRGEKKILLQKRRMYEYKPRTPQPPRLVYLKNVISVKGLPPGDYDLTLILHDEIAGGSSAAQVIKFRIVPPEDPTKKEKASQSEDKTD